MKTLIKLIGFILTLAVIAIVAYFALQYSSGEITISKNQSEGVKTVTINSIIDNFKIDQYTLKLKLLDNDKQKDITINNEYEIKYKGFTIRLDSNIKDYCYYENQNLSGISQMPDGLLEWAQSKVK